MRDLSNRMEASSNMRKLYEWNKWIQEIPYITFKEEWDVKIIPPFNGAVIRFWIRHKEDTNASISVYLDCYDVLGIVGKPYWEMYPYTYEDYSDTYRCEMNEVDELLQHIDTELKNQIRNNINNKVKDNPSKFYTYSQNNSGGYFVDDDKVSEYVIIEAKSMEQANNIAESVGIYFNGVSTGEDCSCCGDRWCEIYDEEDGKDIPMIYDTSVYEYRNNYSNKHCYIYYLDGRKEKVEFKG